MWLLRRLRNKIRISAHNHVTIDASVRMSGCTIHIGKGCTIGHGSYLSAKEKNIHVTLGRGCMLSRNATLLSSDGHPIYQEGGVINPARSIRLGDHVWLSDDVTILKGVSVGEGSVVGIHSIVTHSLPEHTLSVGSPARVVKESISWDH